MALRKSLLPARRNRKQDQGTARDGDRPHQLQPLLGQPVPRAADRRRLCVDAGTAPVCCWHQLRKGASLDTARTLPETGCAGDGLGTAHGRAPAAIVPVTGHLPAHGHGAGSFAWVERPRCTERNPYSPDEADKMGNLCLKIATAPPPNANQASRCVLHGTITPTSPCSAGDKPAGPRVRGPVAWIAGRRDEQPTRLGI